MKISIHAPTNGATGKAEIRAWYTGISIHAPTNGATDTNRHQLNASNRFQSTLRRTERLTHALTTAIIRVFQSTLRRTERPWLLSVSTKVSRISIHAPTNGATTENQGKTNTSSISIHAPTNGATSLQLIKEYREFNISIHAPTNGATIYTVQATCNLTFQSTLRRTERQK